MLLEICANSYQSAINAQEAGAHRIELCQNLSVGGITPNYELLKQVLSDLSIPVFVLIRPRSGNFVYSDEEFDMMKMDIQLSKELGCTGIVSGVLYENDTIDLDRTHELIELSKPLPFTFHRAFDKIINPFEGLEDLVNIGASRVLSSGQRSTAEHGIELLSELLKASNNKIIILPGAGILPNNASLFKRNGFQEIHASANGEESESKVVIIKAILNSVHE